MAMKPDFPGGASWLDLDQPSLDRAYDQAQWAPNMTQVLQRYADASDRARRDLGAPTRHAYGPGEIEALDFFDCGRAAAPVHVFFHGGAWRSGKARDYAFLAGLFVRAGVHVVLPDFSWVQDCGGDLRPMAAQARRALSWVHAHAARLGGDAQRLFVSGHSSGAHLAAVLATTDWSARGLPADLIRGTVLCSGVYELEPVRRSSRNRYVTIDDASAQDLSPMRHLQNARHPLMVAWGSLESPEFRRQGAEFASAAAAAGLATTPLLVPGTNHFEVLETMGRAGEPLADAALALMRQG